MTRFVESADSIPAMLCRAASEAFAGKPFGTADLTVAAWKKYPERFGLRGYEATAPDHNRVVSALSGAKGMAAKGLLAKEGQGYRLTPKGRLLADGANLGPLDLLSLSRAYALWRESRTAEITYEDAGEFWRDAGRLAGLDDDDPLVRDLKGLSRWLTDRFAARLKFGA